MATGTGMKLRAYGELIRLDLASGAGFFVVAGQVFATGGLPPLPLAVTGFIALFFISGSANIANDYFDRDVDRINLPSRPLPSGRVSAGEVLSLFLLTSASGLAAAALLGPVVFVPAVLLWGLSFLYNMKLKEYGVSGNLVVAFCVGMTVIIGGLSAGNLSSVVLTFGILAFLFDLGEEIAADSMDLAGDRVRSSRSLAGSRGRAFALRLSALIFGIFIALIPVPFLAGWPGYGYLLIAAVFDLWMIVCVVNLAADRSIDEGRVWIRRLYLSWGVFMILVVLIRVLP